MAKKRPKPIAEHIEAQHATPPETQPEQPAPESPAPDIFDQIIAARAAEKPERANAATPIIEQLAASTHIEQPAATDTNLGHKAHHEETAAEVMNALKAHASDDSPTPLDTTHAHREHARRHGEPKGGITRASSQPNPFAEDTVALTNDNDGPRTRFYRERRNPDLGIYENANVIQFDAKPADEELQKLRDNNWSFNAKHKVWKKPLGEHPAVDAYKNQKLFREIANSIRAANELKPVAAVGNGLE